ncbi:DUF4192 family protein [Saccharothrix xinjiangensis]|uniref:DUF4192 family protein n=1 Tax=Saccharothrix xinjiangensis TaxID=204798 RepID=A0ABV9YBY1_9PSEU
MRTTTSPDDTTTDTHDTTTTPAAMADFYALHDTELQWLGTLHGATDPDSLRQTATGRQLLNATTPQAFTAAVTDLLHASDEQDTRPRYLPTDGWPWPWHDYRHADWVYLCDDTRAWVATRTARFPSTPTVLLPHPDDVLARRATLIDDLATRTSTTDDHPTEPDTPSRRRSRFDLIHEHILRTADRTDPLTDTEIAALAFALTDPMVRDAALSFATGEHAHAAQTLWTQLTAATPAPERAEPAALLAAFAYLHHDPDLATAATAHALNAHPEHRLSRLISEVIVTDLAPDHLLAMAHNSHNLIAEL